MPHSKRIVVALQSPVVGPPQLYLLEPDTDSSASRPMALEPAALTMLEQLAAALNKAPDRERMEEIGRELFNVLNTHPAIKASVVPLLDLNSPHNEPFYLYFEHRMQGVEELPWEALFAPNVGFLSQNRNFAVARMLNSNCVKTEWLFEPPLKIVAVLGASGEGDAKIDADAQWESLLKAVRAGKLPVQLKILTCQLALRDTINAQGVADKKHAADTPWVTAELIIDRDELFAQIRGFAPHILHFFCHGTSGPKPQLELATFKDWESDAPGSILIEGEQLKQNADLDGKIWLVTLNCCDTAKSGAGTSSLSKPVACNLVAEGVPVVVGMREQIGSGFANVFCGLFYTALLEELRLRLVEAQKDGRTDIHWACGLFAVRQSMYQNVPVSTDWMLPVMHTRLKQFELRINPAQDLPLEDATGTMTTPRPHSRLTAGQIHQLGEELLQLAEDRKLFPHLPAVVKRMDQRIEEINQELLS